MCLVKMNPLHQVQLNVQTVTLSPSEGGSSYHLTQQGGGYSGARAQLWMDSLAWPCLL